MTAASSAATWVDARGMRCPWPALRLARAVRDGAVRLTVLADDPNAATEIAALAAARGWTLAAAADGRFEIVATSSLPDMP